MEDQDKRDQPESDEREREAGQEAENDGGSPAEEVPEAEGGQSEKPEESTQ